MDWIKGLNEKIENIGKKREFLIVFLFSVLMVFGVLLGMGTLTSGYHLVDDHNSGVKGRLYLEI